MAAADALLELDTPVRVLAVLEATRLTGVARNLVEYGRLSADGPSVALSLALIRRDGALPDGRDPVRAAAAAARLPVTTVTERHRYDTSVIDELVRLDSSVQPDIIETHHVKSHCLVAMSGLWRRRTWIAFHHGYTQTDLKVRTYNQADRWSLRRADHVVATNRQSAADLVRRRGVAPGRLTVLHNGVRTPRASSEAVAEMRSLLRLERDERVVLAVGRLSREKGQEYVLRAYARGVGSLGRTRLVLAGEGPDAGRLVHLARALGIAERVTFTGYVRDVARLYALADIFVLPSLTEGSPNALLEAMASGLPVVATRVGGVPEVARDGVTALLVPARHHASMAAAIARLLGDRNLAACLGASARREVLSHYTHRRRAAVLDGLYVRLATAGRCPVAAGR